MVLHAQVNPVEAGGEQEVKEVVADEGHHSSEMSADCGRKNTRTYVPEPKRKRRTWADGPAGWKGATVADRRRAGGGRGKRLQRKSSELAERSFAHVCEAGGARRTWIRGLEDVTGRYVVRAAAFNLGVPMREPFGVGKPRTL